LMIVYSDHGSTYKPVADDSCSARHAAVVEPECVRSGTGP